MKYKISNPQSSVVDQKLRNAFYMDVSSNIEPQCSKFFEHDVFWFNVASLCSNLWSQFRQFRDPLWNQ